MFFCVCNFVTTFYLQEEERDQQKQELSQLRENSKKMKSAIQSKQLLHDAHKKEMAAVLEKLKSEEQSRKSFQKVPCNRLVKEKVINYNYSVY
jgi:DNA gyrase/topoisomerase IV subunit A